MIRAQVFSSRNIFQQIEVNESHTRGILKTVTNFILLTIVKFRLVSNLRTISRLQSN